MGAFPVYALGWCDAGNAVGPTIYISESGLMLAHYKKNEAIFYCAS